MRRLLLVLLVALLAVPAATADGDRLAAAFVKTASVHSVRATIAGTITAQGQTVPVSASGAVDTRARAARFAFRLAVPGSARISFSLVVKGRTLYLRFPLLTRLAGAKKPWVKLDLGKAAAGQGLDLGPLLQADPSQQLALACALRGATRNLGRATVGGVATTHYRSLLDYQEAAHCAPAAQRAGLARVAKQLASLPAVPIDVYVDAQGFVRRTAVALALRSGKTRAATALTVDLSGFDLPVDVHPPPASQVQSLKNLSVDLGGILGGG